MKSNFHNIRLVCKNNNRINPSTLFTQISICRFRKKLGIFGFWFSHLLIVAINLEGNRIFTNTGSVEMSIVHRRTEITPLDVYCVDIYQEK